MGILGERAGFVWTGWGKVTSASCSGLNEYQVGDGRPLSDLAALSGTHGSPKKLSKVVVTQVGDGKWGMVLIEIGPMNC